MKAEPDDEFEVDASWLSGVDPKEFDSVVDSKCKFTR